MQAPAPRLQQILVGRWRLERVLVYNPTMRLFCGVKGAIAAVILLATAGSCVAQEPPCVFTLSPTSVTIPAGGGTGTITVTANDSECGRTAMSSVEWISILYGSAASGSGTIGYAVAANPSPAVRMGNITVADQIFTITQQAAPVCDYALSPSSATLPWNGGAGSFAVAVAAGCAWTAASDASWLAVSAGSGNGSGAVSYFAAPNPAPVARTGSIAVGTRAFSAVQSAGCLLLLTPASVNVPAGGASGTAMVTANWSTCDRAASSEEDWILITSGGTGAGSGSFSYTVLANSSGQPRSGTVMVGHQIFMVRQDSGACSVTVTPTSPFPPLSGGAGTLAITSNCAWTAVSNNDWLSITSGASGTGNGTLAYLVTANPSGATRFGSLTIGGLTYSISQAGVSCAITLGAASASVPSSGGFGMLSVTAPAECNWMAVSSVSWIVISSGSTGAGNGSVSYTVTANTAAQPRTGSVAVGSQVFTISQPAASCDVKLSSTGTSVPASGGSGSFSITTSCSWTATSSVQWITLSGASGAGDGSVGYSVAANPSPEARTGAIMVDGQKFTITQAGVSCSVVLAPSSAEVAGRGESGTVSVKAGAGCKWTVESGVEWIKITSWSNVSGAGVVNYSVSPNPSRNPRTGTVAIGGQTFTVTQGPAEVLISSSRVVNAASFAPGAVAPGEVITIFGSGLGPLTPVTLQLSADGRFVTSSLTETRVLFDGISAALLYVSEGQVSAIVPYAVAGKTETQLEVESQGGRSKAVKLNVAAAAPGLFTQSSSGAGQGAILNQDFKPNSATNPAAKSSVVMLYATGAGQTTPPGVDGQLATTVLPKPQLGVTVRIGDIDAEVLYAGAAPGLVAGVLQVNARVPPKASSGSAIPVLLRVGNFASQTQVTMAVK